MADTFEDDSNNNLGQREHLFVNSVKDIADYTIRKKFSFRVYNGVGAYSLSTDENITIEFGSDFSLKGTDLFIAADRAKVIFHSSDGNNTIFDDCNVNIVAHSVKFGDNIGVYNSTLAIATQNLVRVESKSDFVHFGKNLKFYSDHDLDEYRTGHILKINSTSIKFGENSYIRVPNFMLNFNLTHSTKVEFGYGVKVDTGRYSSRVDNTHYDKHDPVNCSEKDVITTPHKKLSETKPGPESEFTMKTRKPLFQQVIDTVKSWFGK